MDRAATYLMDLVYVRRVFSRLNEQEMFVNPIDRVLQFLLGHPAIEPLVKRLFHDHRGQTTDVHLGAVLRREHREFPIVGLGKSYEALV